MSRVIFVLMLALVSAAIPAQDEGGTFMRANELLGYPVTGEDGVPLGFLQDFVIRRDGSIPFIVVQFQTTGYSPAFDRYLIPTQRIETERNEDAVVITDFDISSIQDMPGFGEEGIAGLDDRYWDSYYGWWGMSRGPLVSDVEEMESLGFRLFEGAENVEGVLASEFLDFDFVDPAGEDVGSVEDLMLNVDERRIAYLGLSFGGFLGVGDRIVAVPLNRVSVDAGDESILVEITEEELENAEGLGDTWPARPESTLFERGG